MGSPDRDNQGRSDEIKLRKNAPACYLYLRYHRKARTCFTRVDDAETYTSAVDLAVSRARCVEGAPRPQRWEHSGAVWELGSNEELNSGLAARSPWETVMIEQFKVFISQQGQALSIALLVFLFGGALLLGLI
jgi:hypothetical protein